MDYLLKSSWKETEIHYYKNMNEVNEWKQT
jgi:hypothetical protein